MGISCGIEEKTEAHFCERQQGVRHLLCVRRCSVLGRRRTCPPPPPPFPLNPGSPCRSPLSPGVLAVLGLNPRPNHRILNY